MSGKQRRARLDDIARIAGALREPVETPDFTSSILERVHAEKPFMAPRTRRWVPVVRIGAAGVALLSVFVLTLIIFVKPEIPETLGARESVTTELVQSAEAGVALRVAGVRETVQKLSREVDPRQLLEVRLNVARATPPEPMPSASTDGVAVYEQVRPEPVGTVMVSFVTIRTPLPTPVPLALPQAASEPMDYASFTQASFAELPLSADERSVLAGWRRGAAISQPRPGRPMYLPTFARPRLNHESSMLVKELFPLITGQPAGEELQIR